MSIRLDPTERRVLGSLVEKELSVPESYPLTLNSLVLACNQKSNRDPETDFREHEVEGAVRALMDRGWVHEMDLLGGRTRRYAHRAGDQLGLDARGLSLLAELLLRGPQTVPELERRCARMRPFSGPDEVERRLGEMAALPVPFVRRLERHTGERHPRWEHLFGEDPAAPRAATGAAGPTAHAPTAHVPTAQTAQVPRAPAPEAHKPAAAARPTLEDLAARVERLERDVAELRARSNRPG